MGPGRMGAPLESGYLSNSGFPVGFRGGSEVKNLPAMQETWVRSLGREDPLEKGSLPSMAQSALCLWLVWNGQPCQGHTGLGSDSDLPRGHSANAKRIIPIRMPRDSLCKMGQEWRDDGKDTLSNFSLSVISRNSSQFVITPFCFIASLLQSTSHQPG